MSKLNLKRAPRIVVQTSAGEVSLRPLNALDISDLVNKFDLETIELATRIMNHVREKKPINELFTDPRTFTDLLAALPDLAASAVNLCAGGDDDDHDAIRELPAEDFAMLVAKMVQHSLQRIGGLGNLLDLATEAAGQINTAFEREIQKMQDTNSASESGATSPS